MSHIKLDDNLKCWVYMVDQLEDYPQPNGTSELSGALATMPAQSRTAGLQQRQRVQAAEEDWLTTQPLQHQLTNPNQAHAAHKVNAIWRATVFSFIFYFILALQVYDSSKYKELRHIFFNLYWFMGSQRVEHDLATKQRSIIKWFLKNYRASNG